MTYSTKSLEAPSAVCKQTALLVDAIVNRRNGPTVEAWSGRLVCPPRVRCSLAETSNFEKMI